MTAVLVIEGIAIVLLAVLVVGLLRSNADVMRALHELGAGEPGTDGSPRRRHQHQAPTREGASPDIAGSSLSGSVVHLGISGAPHSTLLAFLSTGCSACIGLWEGLKTGVGQIGAEDTRLVVVTKGPEAESESRLRELAPEGVTLVQSTDAWADYEVPVSPYFVLVDGTACVPLSSAQDHKRIFDEDRGPNTGGMGAFSPSPRMTPAVERRVLDEIVRPVLDGMAREGHPFRGFLYVGLMLTPDGPRVVEFNVRFGDPEAQVVMPRLDEDLSWLLGSAAAGALPSRPARFRDEPHVGVVLATAGYPDAPKTGQVITGVDRASNVPGALVFHAATSLRDGQLVTSGGRVLTVVGRGAGYREAIAVAYTAASHIRFDGMQLRTDIGRKALIA